MSTAKNFVVGNGLIANHLGCVDFGRPVLVLASGVSDSQERRAEAFQREKRVVDQSIKQRPDLHVLYFSTCSIESGIDTPYIAHKLEMEGVIRSVASSCHIFRLPQIVGLVHNRTLVSYFVESIMHGQVLKMHTRATRNLLDVRDMARVAELLVRLDAGADVPLNIASATEVPVIAIVTEIARLLDRPASIEMIDAGYSQQIDISFLRKILPFDESLFLPGYWSKVLQYYVPLIAGN